MSSKNIKPTLEDDFILQNVKRGHGLFNLRCKSCFQAAFESNYVLYN